MENLNLNGKIYISSKRAAKLSGYAVDYVGQLCRAGKIEATRLGRVWYVTEESLLSHKKINEELTQLRHAEIARQAKAFTNSTVKAVELPPVSVVPTTAAPIKTTTKPVDLVPNLKKLDVRALITPASTVPVGSFPFFSQPLVRMATSALVMVGLAFSGYSLENSEVAHAFVVKAKSEAGKFINQGEQVAFRLLDQADQSATSFIRNSAQVVRTGVGQAVNQVATDFRTVTNNTIDFANRQVASVASLGSVISTTFDSELTKVKNNLTEATDTINNSVTSVVTDVGVATKTSLDSVKDFLKTKVQAIAISAQSFEVPDLPSLPILSLPTIQIPQFSFPDITLPRFDLPTLSLDHLAIFDFQVPKVDWQAPIVNLKSSTKRVIEIAQAIYQDDVQFLTDQSARFVAGVHNSVTDATSYIKDAKESVVFAGVVAFESTKSFITSTKQSAHNQIAYVVDNLTYGSDLILSAVNSTKENITKPIEQLGDGLRLAIADRLDLAADMLANLIGDQIGRVAYLVSDVKTTISGVPETRNVFSGERIALASVASTLTSPFENLARGVYIILSPLFEFGGGQSSGIAKQTPSIPAVTVRPPTLPSASPTIVERVTNNRVTERVVVGDISRVEVDAKLQALANKITTDFYRLSTGGGGSVTNIYQQIAQSQRIDQLANTVITSPSISGGSISGANISGGSLSATSLVVTGTGTSTLANGIDISDGCFAIDGVCIGGGGGGSGDVGVGTIGQLPYYAAAGSTLAATSSLFLSTAGNFGLGTTSPYARLSVEGSSVLGNSALAGYFIATSTTASVFPYASIGNATSTSASSTNLFATTASSTNLFSANANFGGLTVSSLTGPLQAISGTVSATSTISPVFGGTGLSTLPSYGQLLVGNALGGYTLTATSSLGITSQWTTTGSSIYYNTGNVGIGTSSPYTALAVAGSTGVLANLFTATSTTATSTISTGGFAVGTNQFIVQQTSGNVGIGTINPSTLLHLSANTAAAITVESISASPYIDLLQGAVGNPNAAFRIYTGVAAENQFQIYDIRNSAFRTTINNAGNLGVGTTSPGQRLSVAGDILGNNIIGSYFTGTSTTATSTLLAGLNVSLLNVSSTTASSTFANGINLAAGCFSLSGTCIGAGTPGGSNTEVQFNNNGAFGGDSTYTFNSTTKLVSMQSLLVSASTSLQNFTGLLATTSSATSTNLFVTTASSTRNSSLYSTTTALYVSGATTTQIANGINLADGCFAIDDVCIGGSSGSGVVNAGAIGQIAYYAGAGTTLTATSSIFLSTASTIGISSTTPWGLLSVHATSSIPSFVIGSSTATTFIVNHLGKIGVGTSTPYSLFSINAASSTFPFFTIGSSTATTFTVSHLGRVGIGTSSPYAALSVVGSSGVVADIYTATSTSATSSFAGGLSVGGGALQYDFTTGITSVDNLATGPLSFDTDAGIVGWTDIPLSSSGASLGSVQSYSAMLNGTSTLTVYGLATGVGSIIASSTAVGISSTTPWAALSVSPVADQHAFAIGSSTATQFIINKSGFVGIGTSTPYAKLSVVGTTPVTPVFSLTPSNGQSGNILDITNNTGTLTSAWGANGRFGFGTTTPYGLLSINATSSIPSFVIGSSTATTFIVDSTRKVGIGTTTPYGLFSINAASSTFPFFTIGSSTATTFIVNHLGNVGIGTSTPYAALSVVGASGVVADIYTATSTSATSSFSGGLSVGGGALQYDFTTGITSVDNLALGALSFEADSGQVVWIDLPVTSSASAGTVESYIGQIDGNPLLSVYSISDGLGGVTNSGVGIGTSTPSARLTVWATTTNSTAFNVINNASSTLFNILDTGRVGIGTTSPWASLSLNNTAGVPAFAIGSSTATTTFIVASSGFVGIASTTPWRTLSVNGSVAFNGLTVSAGSPEAVCIDPVSKEITQNSGATNCTVSSQRFKHDILDLDEGLDAVMALHPVTFKLNANDESHVGFIAEEVNLVDPRLVFYDSGTNVPRGVRYEEITALLTKAIQEQQTKIEALESGSSGSGGGVSIASVLSSIEALGVKIINGLITVKNLIAESITAKNITVKGEDVTKTGITIYDRVTGEPVCMFVANGATATEAGACATSSVSGSGDGSNTSTTTPTGGATDTEAPVITVVGNNPANIDKGVTYLDLGATVTDNVDNNLGIQVTGDQIDTSVSGTYMVNYSATDQAGNTGTATRTVIVTDPAASTGTTTPTN